MGYEIEKKFLVEALPEDPERFPYHEITQGYLCRHPAVRVRREQRFAGDTPDGDAADGGRRAADLPAGGDSGRPRAQGERFYLTYKGLRTAGALAQEEYNLALTAEAYAHLLTKADGTVIEKRRYLLPLNADAFTDREIAENAALQTWLAADKAQGAWLSVESEDAPKIELDVFAGAYDGLIVAEVEFPSAEIAALYRPASWFGEEVTGDERYSNAWMAERAG